MALIDRIFRDMPNDFEGYIANHEFSAAVWFVATGRVTRAQATAALGLDVTDDPQLDELVAHYAALSIQEKRAFHSDLEAAGVLAEGGKISRTMYKNIFGLS